MMSPDKTDAGKDKQASAGRKTASARPQEPALKCPRCGSPNTKFCYYNNYSLTQQRHFCKTCRRYWTKGGALRNVPIGGGCRKNKKMKSSISPIRASENSNNSNGSSSNISGLKLFQGISPAMDFQIQPPSSGLFNQFSSFGDKITNPCLNQEMGLINFPFTTTSPLMGFQEIGSLTQGNHIASSIESLSSINQELHWKLQQQRLAMLFVGDNDNNQKDNTCVPSGSIEGIVQKPQPILFQNLDISKADQSYNKIETSRKDGNLSTEWFFDNTFGTANQTPATSGSNMNENSRGWNPIQAWSDLDQYNALP